MNVIKCYCPNCGAPTAIESDNMYRDYMFCVHCGAKILLSDNVNRIVDVGKLKEEENKKYFFDKNQEIKKQENDKHDKLIGIVKKMTLISTLVCGIGSLFVILVDIKNSPLKSFFGYIIVISLLLATSGFCTLMSEITNGIFKRK